MHKKSRNLLKLSLLFTVAVIVWLAGSCVKGEKAQSGNPDTKISIENIDLSGDNRLNSNITLSWFGTDADGYVVGYEISVDEQNWTYTTAQDSTFVFSIPEGSDTTDVDLYVRSIDNDGLRDLTPAHLRIPLKNTPPVASFNDERGPTDTSLAVATFYWTATDVDGEGTISKVEIRFNDGDWYEISRGENLISFVMDTNVTSGSASARVYYGTENTAEPGLINGVLANAENKLYIRAADIAGSVSAIDTSDTFFFKNKTPGVRTLWVTGQSESISSVYHNTFNNISLSYDFLDFSTDDENGQLPRFWDPTFELITGLYDVVFVNADGARKFTNPVTGRSATLLDFMAPAIQAFTTGGGKSFITTKFDLDVQLSNIIGTYPIEGIVTGSSPGSQARIIPPDSGIVPVDGAPYPKLVPVTFQTQVIPVRPSSDAQPFYRGQLTLAGGWTGTKTMATVRRPNNQLQQVFFAVQLHEYNSDPAALEQLFEEILINEF